ncbi:MAG: YfaP family protein [Gemmatimonadaceae bacterium]
MRAKSVGGAVRLTLVALLALATGSCIDWKQTTAVPEESVKRFISLVQTLDGTRTATLVKRATPAAGSGAAVSAVLPNQVLRGGTVQTTVTSATPFNRVVFDVPGNTDHWELDLGSSVNSVTVLLVIAVEMPKTVFTLRMAGGGASVTGPYQSQDLGVIFVGTGEIQTNVTWDTKADVDLHLIDPTGKEIYYASRNSPSGGQLDLDSNAGCGSDGPRAENIFWGDGIIVPHGEYILRVDYWSSCGAPATNYTVTINLRGLPPKIFTGTLTGTGSRAAAGAGKTIAVFTY